MILPEYKKLWKPYSIDGCSLERTVAWARKRTGAGNEVMTSAVKSLMIELASGREFPKDGCDPDICQCDFQNAHTAINHHFLKMVQERKDFMAERYWQVLETLHRDEMIAYIEAQNWKYIKKNMTPWYRKVFSDWICNLIEKI